MVIIKVDLDLIVAVIENMYRAYEFIMVQHSTNYHIVC